MPGINTKVSTSTYQQCDGSNFSTAGFDCSTQVGNGKLSTYAGIGTCFTKGSTGAIIDVKGSIPYGKTCFSGGFRVRNNLNENSKTVQFRIQPVTTTVPLNKNTSIYVTPYYATKLNYENSKTTDGFGCFAGVNTKVGKTNIFFEGQIYDVNHINKSNTSVNAGISFNL